MSYTYLLTEKRDGVFILTLNRPEKRNALNNGMWAEIAQAVGEFEADDECLAMIVTNTGPCFCAGSDLKEIAAGEHYAPAGHEHDGFAMLTGHYCEKPIIAAVNGMCMGGGAEIVLACDIAVLSSDCVIGYPEVKRGLLAAGGAGLLRLAQAIPVKFALELLLTGESIDAQTAVRWGIANHVAEPGAVLDKALEIAGAIANNGPVAVRRTKRFVYENMNQAWLSEDNPAWDAVLASDEAIKETEDAKEGSRAFAEKRPPVWRNC